MSVPDDFWSTSAQTLPVLALAQVIEARALASQWTNKWSKADKFLIAYWSIPLIGYAIATPVCFMALQDRPISDGWATFVFWTIGAGVSFLVVNPAASFLVAANSRTIARLVRLVTRISFRFDIRRLRKANETSIRTVKNRRDMHRIEVESFKEMCEEWTSLPADNEENLQRARQHLATGQEFLASSTALYNDLLDQRDRIDVVAEQTSESRKAALEELDDLIRKAALSTQMIAKIEQESSSAPAAPVPSDESNG